MVKWKNLSIFYGGTENVGMLRRIGCNRMAYLVSTAYQCYSILGWLGYRQSSLVCGDGYSGRGCDRYQRLGGVWPALLGQGLSRPGHKILTTFLWFLRNSDPIKYFGATEVC